MPLIPAPHQIHHTEQVHHHHYDVPPETLANVEQCTEEIRQEVKREDKWSKVALWLIVLLLLLLFMNRHGWAQQVVTTPIKVVTACGGASLPNGSITYNFFMNSAGQICINATVSASVVFPYTYTSAQTPTAASFIGVGGMNPTPKFSPLQLDASNYLYVNCVVGCSGGATTPTDAFANPTTAGLAMVFPVGWNGTTWDRLQVDGSKYLKVNVETITGLNLVSVSGTTLSMGQQTAANSLPVILPSATITTLTPPAAITNYANETGGNLTAIKADTDKIPSQGQALAAASMPVVLTAAQITTLTPPAAITNYALETGGNLATLAGAVSGSLFQANISKWGGSALGAMANYGTSPGAVLVPGVNAFVTNSVAVTGSFYQATQPISIASGQVASGAIASGAIASGAVASGAYASGAISDGAEVTLGAKADAKSAATDTTAITIMQVMKEISAMEQAPASRAVTNAGTFADQATLQTQTDTVMVGGVNVKEINAVTPLMGAGATGTGSQRVTAAQDTTTIAGSAPGTAGSASANVITVQGVASMTKLLVTPDSVALPANQSVNVAQVNGHTTVEATTSGVQKVGIVGNAGAAVDAVMAAAVPANGVQIAGRGSGAAGAPVMTAPIVCDNWTPFSLASTTSLKIVTKATSKNVYICSINIVSATAQNVALIAGTKTTTDCDTSTAGLAGGTTGAAGWNFAANGGLTQGSGVGVITATASTGLDVCLLSSGTGQLSGVISWAQF